MLLCVCVSAVGCNSKRQQRQSIDALHKELRWQEDQIYQLQDAIEQYQEALENCRAGQRSSHTPNTPTPRRDPIEDNGNDIVPELPRVELGEPDENGGGLPPIDGVPAPGEPMDHDAPPRINPTESEPKPVDMSSADVKEIRVHRILTGGLDRDGRPGDEGVQVVIEPLDVEGKVVPTSGDIAIALMDHTLPEGNQRLAFWTIEAKDAEKQLRRGGISDGLQFELMWGSDRYPVHRDLDLYVRYTTSDGRHLDARRKVRIRLPEDVAHWKKLERLPDVGRRQPKSIRPVTGIEAIAP